MDTDLPTQLAGEAVSLLGQRALWWPARGALLIADLHLGKADTFRRAGIALPRGGTHDDLQRLQALLQAYPCRELWILGDVLHGATHAAAWQQQWQAWRARHAGVGVHVIRGNHDRQLQQAALDVVPHEEAVPLGPFLLCHHPQRCDDAHVIAGHLHPQVALPALRRRFPAFWLQDGLSVLPAFSAFTAGGVPAVQRGDRLVACVQGHAIEVPQA
ncbi:ligase-associated DNA damage response endonuclease PdeM [Stenotrophomonas sp. 24(2023)]|uniref:ligase-associated DNA damage response endonuclease PdeM n=1 Tax=Stenotrophomonas sp. 24(2023) TaxID=3068324 RepID=UPI0027E00445|nr:ligase-associated DNA damage response endonuclease PdeM [Stenotrophomonas sp. 24(2023)]WMJ70075.1 ligase-associated DNA damage response endonuclease PdeM [Stenotrophomonas sp. 24(2023)]